MYTEQQAARRSPCPVSIALNEFPPISKKMVSAALSQHTVSKLTHSFHSFIQWTILVD